MKIFKNFYTDKPVLSIQIENFEKKFGIRLSQDYVNFISKFNGVDFGENAYYSIHYNGSQHKIPIMRMIDFKTLKSEIIPYRDEHDGYLNWKASSQFIPIGIEEECRYIYIGVSPPYFGEIHIVPFWGDLNPGDGYQSIKIANSFNEFLRNILSEDEDEDEDEDAFWYEIV